METIIVSLIVVCAMLSVLALYTAVYLLFDEWRAGTKMPDDWE